MSFGLIQLASFLVAIGILIAAHEYGHFWVARRLGFKVLKFSIGFGRAPSTAGRSGSASWCWWPAPAPTSCSRSSPSGSST
jgi:regulator of sigma E protease